MEALTTVDAVIDAFKEPRGGRNQGCADVAGVSAKAVHNWRARGQMPSDTYLILKDALAEKGKTAPPRLWGIREPQSQQPGE